MTGFMKVLAIAVMLSTSLGAHVNFMKNATSLCADGCDFSSAGIWDSGTPKKGDSVTIIPDGPIKLIISAQLDLDEIKAEQTTFDIQHNSKVKLWNLNESAISVANSTFEASLVAVSNGHLLGEGCHVEVTQLSLSQNTSALFQSSSYKGVHLMLLQGSSLDLHGDIKLSFLSSDTNSLLSMQCNSPMKEHGEISNIQSSGKLQLNSCNLDIATSDLSYIEFLELQSNTTITMGNANIVEISGTPNNVINLVSAQVDVGKSTLDMSDFNIDKNSQLTISGTARNIMVEGTLTVEQRVVITGTLDANGVLNPRFTNDSLYGSMIWVTEAMLGGTLECDFGDSTTKNLKSANFSLLSYTNSLVGKFDSVVAADDTKLDDKSFQVVMPKGTTSIVVQYKEVSLKKKHKSFPVGGIVAICSIPVVLVIVAVVLRYRKRFEYKKLDDQ